MSYFSLILMNLFAVSFIYYYCLYNSSAKKTHMYLFEYICKSLSRIQYVHINGILGNAYSYKFSPPYKTFFARIFV